MVEVFEIATWHICQFNLTENSWLDCTKGWADNDFLFLTDDGE